MDDLISRQAAIDSLEEEPEVWDDDDEYGMGQRSEWCHIKKTIEKLPSADVRENVRGKWITDHLVSTGGGTYPVLRCSECENQEPMLMAKKFCPNCGADMRGKSK